MHLHYKVIKSNHQKRYVFREVWFDWFPACLVLLLLSVACKRGSTDEFTAKTGYFRQSVIETGELEAINALSITMPQLGWQYGYQFKIVGLLENGKNVLKGDSVVSLDPSSIFKFILDRESMLENEVAASNKQKVDMDNKIQELNAQMKTEQAAYDLKKLELERIKFEVENKRKIKELEFQQSTIRINKIKRNIDLKPKLNQYDRKIQEIRILQREVELKNAKETLCLMVIRSAQDGIFQIKTNWDGQNTKLGDNVYLGALIARIPDIRKMRVKTCINETDIRKVKLGMKTIVRLDALPNVPFTGVITKISMICTQKENQKVFDVEVTLPETDLRLKPGMTVSSEFVSYESEKDIFVPNKCLLREAGNTYLYVKKGMSSGKVKVEAGPSNSNYTIVKGDIKPGQKLVPFENIQLTKK